MSSSQPPPVIISPQPGHPHTQTIILLHGTSGNGLEFSTSLLNSPITYPFTADISPVSITQHLSSKPEVYSSVPSSTSSSTSTTTQTTLPGLFPSTKFIFPTGHSRTVTALNGVLTNAWFDVHAFTDRRVGEDDSIPGLRQSTMYLAEIVRSEIQILDEMYGKGEGRKRVVIGGFSQGAAMACMLLLSGELGRDGDGNEFGMGVERWVLMSGWMPFRRQIEEIVKGCEDSSSKGCRVRDYVRSLLGLDEVGDVIIDKDIENSDHVVEKDGEKQMRICVQHGSWDQKMLLEWGEQMFRVLERMGYDVSIEVFDMGHSWSVESLGGLAKWLENNLPLEVEADEAKSTT